MLSDILRARILAIACGSGTPTTSIICAPIKLACGRPMPRGSRGSAIPAASFSATPSWRSASDNRITPSSDVTAAIESVDDFLALHRMAAKTAAEHLRIWRVWQCPIRRRLGSTPKSLLQISLLRYIRKRIPITALDCEQEYVTTL